MPFPYQTGGSSHNDLISVFVCWDDIIDELGLNYDYAPKTDTFMEPPPPLLDGLEKTIYDMIGDYPVHIDNIARRGHLEPGKVSSILMKLELKGIVKQLPGKMFVR